MLDGVRKAPNLGMANARRRMAGNGNVVCLVQSEMRVCWPKRLLEPDHAVGRARLTNRENRRKAHLGHYGG